MEAAGETGAGSGGASANAAQGSDRDLTGANKEGGNQRCSK